jgi:hypothetical protein
MLYFASQTQQRRPSTPQAASVVSWLTCSRVIATTVAGLRTTLQRRATVGAACIGCILAAARCSDNSSGGSDACKTDLNGASGGSQVVDLAVDDTAFSVGAGDSGSMQPNVTIENASTVTLTLVNVGTKPHDMVVQCQPTPNTMGCPGQSCFPPDANIPPLQPGESTTTSFVAPFKEGPYRFTSDVDGDTKTSPDGGVTGLVGEFVLL